MRVIANAAAAAGFVAAAALAAPAAAGTLDTVKQRGKLVCGVSQGLMGFSARDGKEQWSGFDVDFCRAIAAAIFDDPAKVEFVPLSAAERFEALKSGKVDVLSRNSTWTLGREVDHGIVFTAVNYYDGQGFLVPKARAIGSALEMNGMKVCVQAGTTSEVNLRDFSDANGMTFETVVVSSPEEAVRTYSEGGCTAISSDVSQLHAERLALENPSDHSVLPDIISKEPLAPAVRSDDMVWFTIVKWVSFAMLNAEELGVSSTRIDEALRSSKPDVRRLVGTEGGFGEKLGLTNDWVVRIVRAVGNYGEVYERNVGVGSKLGIPRGINQLWSLGGIQYAPPLR